MLWNNNFVLVCGVVLHMPRYVHSPLKRNVKELSLLAAGLMSLETCFGIRMCRETRAESRQVKSQDILLRALTRKHSPRWICGSRQQCLCSKLIILDYRGKQLLFGVLFDLPAVSESKF